ncbi:unnamed protein product [Orchesella dallaii]|uniref:Secreted protein n=1 Tax=Orchesella dallaii TaxID=48710 RepID=A0ABP1R8W7_9HEXA
MKAFVFIATFGMLYVLTTAQNYRRDPGIRDQETFDDSRSNEVSSSRNLPPIFLNLIVVPVVRDGNRGEEMQAPLTRPMWPDSERLTDLRTNMVPTSFSVTYGNEQKNNLQQAKSSSSRGPQPGVLATPPPCVYSHTLRMCIPAKSGGGSKRPPRESY